MAAFVATNQTILVVGGGISGITAALEAASGSRACLSGHVIRARKLEEIAVKVIPAKKR